jgi:hypothetical protein
LLALAGVGLSVPARADNELASVASTFYILAPGSDASIGPIVHTLTDRLQQLFDRTQGAGTVWVIPRLNWGPSDLQSQCENDPGKDKANGPKVLGGVILEGTNTYAGQDPLVIWNHGWAKVSTNAELVACKPAGFEKPTIAWVRNNLNGYGSRNGVPFETVAAGALAATLTNTDAKTILVGAAIGGITGASTIPPVDDSLTSHDAAVRVVNDLVTKLNAACGTNDANIHPMCVLLGLPAQKLPPLQE